MNNRNETTVFDKMFFPKKHNYEYTSEYFASKGTEAQRNLAKRNCGDNIERNVDISNYYYYYKRALEKTTKKLEHKRKDYNEKRKTVQSQWEDLKVKEDSLRQNFIRFNQFVKENQEKKERAANKINEQNQLKIEKQQRMDEMITKCTEISKVKASMDINISRYRIYEQFLTKVVEQESSIQSINDLLKRYEALIGARKELNDIQQRDMNKLEKAKTNLKIITEDFLTKVGQMNNKVTELQERYETARLNCKKWERFSQYTKEEAMEQVIYNVSIKETCEKLYREVCRRKKIKPIYINDVEKQLFSVKQAIGEYEIINSRVKELQEKDLKASVEPKVSNMSA